MNKKQEWKLSYSIARLAAADDRRAGISKQFQDAADIAMDYRRDPLEIKPGKFLKMLKDKIYYRDHPWAAPMKFGFNCRCVMTPLFAHNEQE